MPHSAKLASWFFLGSMVAFPFVATVAWWIGEESKARDSSEWALLGEVVVGWIFAVMGTLAVGIVGVLLRKRLMPAQKARRVSIAWGITYPILWNFLAHMIETLAPNSVGAVALAWIYLLGFPLLLYWAVFVLGSGVGLTISNVSANTNVPTAGIRPPTDRRLPLR